MLKMVIHVDRFHPCSLAVLADCIHVILVVMMLPTVRVGGSKRSKKTIQMVKDSKMDGSKRSRFMTQKIVKDRNNFGGKMCRPALVKCQ